MNAAALIGALRERGIIPADAPAPAGSHPQRRPWFISLLLGIAGWLAGLFVLVFIGLIFDLRGMEQFLVIGLILLAVAWGLYFASRALVFIDQLALALSIAGQLAIGGYFVDRFDEALPVTAAILVMQLVVFAVMPDRIARTIAAFFACVAWVFVVRFWLRPGQGEDMFFDGKPHFTLPMFGAWTLPIEWLLTCIPLIALLVGLMRTETRWMSSAASAFARPAITGLLLALALGGVGAEPVSVLAFGTEAIGREFTWWALFPLLSIVLAMVAAFCAFRLRSTGLLGVAIFAALAHLARFYHLYGTTLMWKSFIMLVAGAVLLAAGVLLTKRLAEARP